MIAIALLMPPLLLGMILLLDKYEDHLRATTHTPRHAQRRPRHLSLVPPLAREARPTHPDQVSDRHSA
ncbi:hypothetical protein J7E93_36315 [Streptomyces sp. ISL-36]|uniref:hypothetical protein n=1 Tax=Streptomyces sp. ISL-36 TaxID=2819182 RepID=UPI001BE655E1|nr:hypothetical protein [Streptomyces sp. ISL-36]MBT2445451.1 hypothetical protein [Streptomyces sp. ISL-36]